MSTAPSTSSKQSTQSSRSEETPDSGTTYANRVYTKTCNSPSLRAFASFAESLGQFRNLIDTKIDLIGIDSVDLLRTELNRLDNKCERIHKDFERLISQLDMAIENYERKKPTDLAPYANSICALEKQAANYLSLSKIQTDIEIFTALNKSISIVDVVIQKKIDKSTYEDYSFSVEKKLKNLKIMCEAKSKCMELIGKSIKHAINKNEELSNAHIK